jgi:hypothetical protein
MTFLAQIRYANNKMCSFGATRKGIRRRVYLFRVYA